MKFVKYSARGFVPGKHWQRMKYICKNRYVIQQNDVLQRSMGGATFNQGVMENTII